MEWDEIVRAIPAVARYLGLTVDEVRAMPPLDVIAAMELTKSIDALDGD